MITRERWDGRWIRWCARAAFLSALPSAAWRVLPGLGLTMGTTEEWRALQDLPGTGTCVAPEFAAARNLPPANAVGTIGFGQFLAEDAQGGTS